MCRNVVITKGGSAEGRNQGEGCVLGEGLGIDTGQIISLYHVHVLTCNSQSHHHAPIQMGKEKAKKKKKENYKVICKGHSNLLEKKMAKFLKRHFKKLGGGWVVKVQRINKYIRMISAS